MCVCICIHVCVYIYIYVDCYPFGVTKTEGEAGAADRAGEPAEVLEGIPWKFKASNVLVIR